MKKLNQAVIGLALVASLWGCSKSQDSDTPNLTEGKIVEKTTLVSDEVITNTTSTVETPANILETDIAPTNTPILVEDPTHTPETVTAPSNTIVTASTEITTNYIEQVEAPKNTLRGIVEIMTPTNIVNEVSASTNTVESTNMPTNTTTSTANTPEQAKESTGTITTTTLTIGNTETTDSGQTVPKENEPTAPTLTAEQKALLDEVVPQIKPYLLKDGMSNEQLFSLGAFMHIEKDVGTRDLSKMYWQAAEAGMDLTPFEEAYLARLQDQQNFMKICQEGIADARINHQDKFTISGVSFNINSPDLVENLLTFKGAKDRGAYSVIIEGQPFKIFRTAEEMQKMMENNAPQSTPARIITPYGIYIRQETPDR